MLSLALGASLLGWAAMAQAAYPDKPLRLVLPFPAGGATDQMARSLAQKPGVTGRTRPQVMAGVPTIAETPGMADCDMALWPGVLAPAGTPADVVKRLHEAIEAAMRLPEVVRQMAEYGIDVRTSSPEEFRSLIRSDLAQWAGVVRKSGMQAQ